MRLGKIAMLALVALTLSSASGFACPPGFSPCGTRSCCPQ